MQHVNPGTGGTESIFQPGDQLRVTQFQPNVDPTDNTKRLFSTNVYQALQLGNDTWTPLSVFFHLCVSCQRLPLILSTCLLGRSEGGGVFGWVDLRFWSARFVTC